MVPCHDFRISKIISNFNGLCVGDFASPAIMAIDMNNSAGAHCVHCFAKAIDFNCQDTHTHDIHTKASLMSDLKSCNQQRLSQKRENNCHGVNCVGFLDMDPQQSTVPIPDCPMRSFDKVLANSRNGWHWKLNGCQRLLVKCKKHAELQSKNTLLPFHRNVKRFNSMNKQAKHWRAQPCQMIQSEPERPQNLVKAMQRSISKRW